MLSSFVEGGISMYLITALDLIGLFFVFLAFVFAVVARIRGRGVGFARVFAILVVIGSFIPVCAGFGGKLYGQHQVAQAVTYASEEVRPQLQEEGARVASIPLNFGAISSLACFLPAIFVLLVLPGRRSRWQAALDDD